MVALRVNFDDSFVIRREGTAGALVLASPIVGLFMGSHIPSVTRFVEAQRTFEQTLIIVLIILAPNWVSFFLPSIGNSFLNFGLSNEKIM